MLYLLISLCLVGIVVSLLLWRQAKLSLRAEKASCQRLTNELHIVKSMNHAVTFAIDCDTQTLLEREQIQGFLNDPQCQLINDFYQYLHPDDLPHATQLMAKLSRTDERFEVALRIMPKNDTIRHIVLSALYITNNQQNARIYCSLIDNTANVQARENEKLLIDNLRQIQKFAQILGWTYQAKNQQLIFHSSPCELYGTSANKQIDFAQHLSFIHPDDQLDYLNILSKIEQGADLCHCSYRIITEKGDVRFIHSTWQNFSDEHGNFTHAVGALQDITAIKRSEAAQAELIQIINDSQKLAKIGTWQWDLHSNETVWTDAVFHMFGYDKRIVEASFENFLRIVHPDERARVKQLTTETIHNHQPYDYNFIALINGKSRTFHSHGYLQYDDDGQAISLVGTVQDIEEQVLAKRRQDQLISELNKQQRAFLITQKIGLIGFFDTNLVTDEQNYSEGLKYIFGYDKYEAFSRDIWLSHIHPDDLAYVQYVTQQIFEKHNHLNPQLTYRIYTKTKAIKHIQVNWNFNRQAEQSLEGTIRDVTERAIAEKREKEQTTLLIHQNRLAQQGEMIQLIAHQWRQPLNQISLAQQMMGRELMKMDIPADNKISHLQKQIKDSIGYLSHTIDDFKNFQVNQKLSQQCQLADVVDEALDVIIGSAFKRNNIAVYRHFEAIAYQRFALFRSELLQVLVAIFNNAIDAFAQQSMPDKSISVSIKSSAQTGCIQLVIADNAGGIAADILPFIFDPYFSTKKDKNGTGLGLYMARMILEKSLDGKINAKNDKFGACFSLFLPNSQHQKESLQPAEN